MRLWLIPMLYAGASLVAGFTLPRLEQAYLASYTLDMSVTSAQAYLSAAASGMMALTAIVFSIAFVMVQFSAIAYSPRLVLWFARDPTLFHSLGIFVATFIYALSTLAWVDRAGSGTVPLVSCILVAMMLIVSVLLFARLVQRLSDLQISNVLHMIGDKGRQVIGEMFRVVEVPRAHHAKPMIKPAREIDLRPVTQTLSYIGKPRTIARFDIKALVQQAREADAVIVMACAVGDTLVEDAVLLRVHGANGPLSEDRLRRAILLHTERTFEQDPKYPLRLLVDIAIKALSPAINDPTTAVQAIDQIEDLLRRIGRRGFDAGYAADADGVTRLIVPMASWEDYLALAFDEIRHFGTSSVQVMRRMRSALTGIAESLASAERADAVRRYLSHLDLAIERSPFDAEDRLIARQEDRQGLGLTRKPVATDELQPGAPAATANIAGHRTG
jgi:uncharacterized membrane protein